ncbi:hypothetical protein F3N42_00745 [Marinihelvus fidelis]|uniref:Uncharacterized protein n=1 Tax=Marinihelvus fidelis TaxID=2613842 RepID=A0A5N0TLB2_9GAMM|nr:hypothetical protein [Marinihelvus fidelis]KAA9134109.1 hypothetical protein F3N42_00745 [Marinihelvus fidelis]
MADPGHMKDKVDLYVAGALSDEETAEFELQMMSSTELQDEVEAALALRVAVEKAPGADGTSEAIRATGRFSAPMARYATAASVLLAIVSVALFWRSNSEVRTLREMLDTTGAPYSSVVQVRLDSGAMRSAGTPGNVRVIQVPPQDGLVLFSLDVPLELAASPAVDLELAFSSGHPSLDLAATPQPNGKVLVAIPARSVPTGRATLLLRSTNGTDAVSNAIDLEFRRTPH